MAHLRKVLSLLLALLLFVGVSSIGGCKNAGRKASDAKDAAKNTAKTVVEKTNDVVDGYKEREAEKKKEREAEAEAEKKKE